MQWNRIVELQSWKGPKESHPSLLVWTDQSRLHWVDALSKNHCYILCFHLAFYKLYSYKAIQLFYYPACYTGFFGTYISSDTVTKHPCSWRHGLCSFLHFSQCIAMGKHSWKAGISPACWTNVKIQAWLHWQRGSKVHQQQVGQW